MVSCDRRWKEGASFDVHTFLWCKVVFPPRSPSLQLHWASMLHPRCILHSLVCSIHLWLYALSMHLRIKNTGKVGSAEVLVGYWKCPCHRQDHTCIPEAERCCLSHTQAGKYKKCTLLNMLLGGIQVPVPFLSWDLLPMGSQENNRARSCIQHSICEMQSLFPFPTPTKATTSSANQLCGIWQVMGRKVSFLPLDFFHWSLYKTIILLSSKMTIQLLGLLTSR